MTLDIAERTEDGASDKAGDSALTRMESAGASTAAVVVEAKLGDCVCVSPSLAAGAFASLFGGVVGGFGGTFCCVFGSAELGVWRPDPVRLDDAAIVGSEGCVGSKLKFTVNVGEVSASLDG